MTSSRSHGIAARLGAATSLLMFGLIVIGSVVRSTGSGLACPDWPLCGGRLIPPFELHVMIEWLHRLVALLVSVMLAVTVGWVLGHRELRLQLGGMAVLAVVLLGLQVLLGALTVWKLLDPALVSGHLAVALLLFSTMLTLTLLAGAEAEGAARGDSAAAPWPAPSAARGAGLLPILALATVMTWAQAVLGGMVSSSHAGTACPDWPTCNGQWFPPLEGLVGLHMAHRLGGYLLTVVVLVAALRARPHPDPRVRSGGALALGLTLAQVTLGVTNVLLGTPAWLSAAHLANAAAMLAVLLATTFRVAAVGVPSPALATAAAR